MEQLTEKRRKKRKNRPFHRFFFRFPLAFSKFRGTLQHDASNQAVAYTIETLDNQCECKQLVQVTANCFLNFSVEEIPMNTAIFEIAYILCIIMQFFDFSPPQAKKYKKAPQLGLIASIEEPNIDPQFGNLLRIGKPTIA